MGENPKYNETDAGAMVRHIAIPIVVLLPLVSAPAHAIEPANDTALREQFETVARKIKIFATSDYVHNRDATFIGDAESTNVAVRSLLRPARRDRSRYPWTDDPWFRSVADLLEHEDPRVRTLAMLAIYHTRDPAAIDRLAGRLSDQALTFPKPEFVALPSFNADGSLQETPVLDQSVADVAESMLRSMIAPSLSNWRLDGKYRDSTLDRFWLDRRGRDHWIGWFVFELGQATRHQSQVLPDTAGLVGDVIRKIQRLPPIEREITLLAVFGSPDDRLRIKQAGYYDGQEMLRYAAIRLGPDRLLRLLAGEALIDDPDLPKHLPTIQRYIYEHATTNLRPSDQATVLELARQQSRADAYIAAARLAPTTAAAVLREAFAVKQGKYEGGSRVRIMIALWQLEGNDEADYLIDWFFDDQSPRLGRSPYRSEWLRFMLDRFDAADRQMLARILLDVRADALTLPEHRTFARKLNRNLLSPVIEGDVIERLHHPFGDSHFDGQIKEARRKFPEETAHVVTELADWRSKLRASVPLWLTAKSNDP